MIIKLVWPDCKLINGEYGEPTVDSFWVECVPEEVQLINPFITAQTENLKMMHEPGTIDDENIAKYCYLVSRNLESVVPMPWSFPYSGQWNSWCPFRLLPKAVNTQNLGVVSTIIIPAELRE